MVGSTILPRGTAMSTAQNFKIVCNHFALQNCRARVNVNATHTKKAVFEIYNIPRHLPI